MKNNSFLFPLPSSLEAIDQLITQELLYIDPIKPAVVVSWQLHLAVMDDEYKASRPLWRWLIRHGWVERDKQYRRLMKAVKIYLELPRGTLQGQYEERLVTQGMDRAEAHREAVLKYPIHDGPLHFIVTDPTDSQPLLLGTYHDDRIALVEAGTPSNSSQARLLGADKPAVVATDAHSASAPSMGSTQSSSQTNIETDENK